MFDSIARKVRRGDIVAEVTEQMMSDIIPARTALFFNLMRDQNEQTDYNFVYAFITGR